MSYLQAPRLYNQLKEIWSKMTLARGSERQHCRLHWKLWIWNWKEIMFWHWKTTILWIMKSLFFSKLLILIFPNFGLFRTLNDKRKQNSVDAISEKRTKSFFLHISPGNSWEYGTLPWVEHVKSQNSCFICEYCSDLIWIIC